MAGILWAIAAIVVVFWLLGFLFEVAGNLIRNYSGSRAGIGG